jgi:bifunctional DNA-binding transcriptional regulator/antitoxin component of YhaV-PrlF toxin-antitoxin module
MARIVRQLRSGQVTIPSDFRKELGITDDSLLEITLIHGELRIKPVQMRTQAKDSAWLQELYQYFAPSRLEATKHSEEEVNADIDAAVKEVRTKHGQGSL